MTNLGVTKPAGLAVLYISNPPRFETNGDVVLGQCEFDTPSWELKLLLQDGPPVLLGSGAYRQLKQVQSRCQGITKVEELSAKAKELLGQIKGPPAGSGLKPVKEGRAHLEAEHRPSSTLDSAMIEKTLLRLADLSSRKGRTAVPETLPVSYQQVKNLNVVRVETDILAAEADTLCDVLTQASKDNPGPVTLDLSAVEQIASRAVHEILRFSEDSRTAGRQFAVVGTTARVMTIFQLLNLDKKISFYKTPEAAAEAFDK
ncbi:MAG: STAS domain-containing protein [Planctomycetota bacterium]